jgi:hypothetical protein
MRNTNTKRVLIHLVQTCRKYFSHSLLFWKRHQKNMIQFLDINAWCLFTKIWNGLGSEMASDMWRLSVIIHKRNPRILNVNNNKVTYLKGSHISLKPNNIDGKYTFHKNNTNTLKLIFHWWKNQLCSFKLIRQPPKKSFCWRCVGGLLEAFRHVIPYYMFVCISIRYYLLIIKQRYIVSHITCHVTCHIMCHVVSRHVSYYISRVVYHLLHHVSCHVSTSRLVPSVTSRVRSSVTSRDISRVTSGIISFTMCHITCRIFSYYIL